MIRKTRKPVFSVLFAAIFMLSAALTTLVLTTCNTPFGFGDAIDWDPPVLTLDPGRNPRYVGLGTTLSGTVTDNVSVDRVILREAGSGNHLFTAQLLPNHRWEILLEFTEERNGSTLAVEIVAFDKAGNSGDQSIAAITLIIDIRPPVVQDMEINRSNVRKDNPRKLIDLLELETEKDKLGEYSDYVEMYQNGYFIIGGEVSEEETNIEIVSLNIYDAKRDLNGEPILSLQPLAGNSHYSPRWLLWEEGNAIYEGRPVDGVGLLTAGAARFGQEYIDNYYNGERYYYLLEIFAIDRGENASNNDTNIIQQEYGYICLWEKADNPKGIIDPRVGTSVLGGATLPVNFFDDDALTDAFSALLTKAQWEGTKPIADGGVNIPPTYTDEEKLEWLEDRLLGSSPAPVYNWRFDIYNGATTHNGTSTQIENLLGGGKQSQSFTEYVQTGNDAGDYGDFVLFSIARDIKLAPHPEPARAGARDTEKPRMVRRFWEVYVADENQPLIVIDVVDTSDVTITNCSGTGENQTHNCGHAGHDLGANSNSAAALTTGNSPEENTFPKLSQLGGSGGNRVFELNGYTLRATKTGANVVENYVKKYRMAWIPAGYTEGKNVQEVIKNVQEALMAAGYPNNKYVNGTYQSTYSMNELEELGVQHWNFVPTGRTLETGEQKDADLLYGAKQDISGLFQRQVFRKKFDVLGGQDDLVTNARNGNSYKNFVYKNSNGVEELENETKLFVLYAEDNMGNHVLRQVRYLSNKKPPKLTVYEITIEDVPTTVGAVSLPNLNGGNYYDLNGNITAQTRAQYQADLAAKQPDFYGNLRVFAFGTPTPTPNQPLLFITDPAYGADRLSVSYQTHPRGTVLKYWVVADVSAEGGDLEVQNIKMEDITYEPLSGQSYQSTGSYNGIDRSLSYIEMLPEVTQRVFLFTATDSLGNIATVQRTVAVTNAAILNDITTTTQSGTYGIGEKITIQANYSSPVKWQKKPGSTEPEDNPPKLNIRYVNPEGAVIIGELKTTTPINTASQSLDFDFVVGEDYAGFLETMYVDIPAMSGGYTPNPQGNDLDEYNRPIRIPNTTEILDSTRGDAAFTPGYVVGFNWTASEGARAKSLQGKKDIKLDGKRPQITGFTLKHGTKQVFTGTDRYYYNSSEKIEFTLTADKDIFIGAQTPQIQFQIGGVGTWHSASWTSSPNLRSMDFSIDASVVNDGLTGADGLGFRINSVANIEDSVGNWFTGNKHTTPPASGVVVIPVPLKDSTTANVRVEVDKTPPAEPPTQLNNVAITATAPANTNYNAPVILSITRNTLPNENIAPVSTQYSLDNGITWLEFPTATSTHGTPAISALGWTSPGTTTGTLNILAGSWILRTRFTDRAGNVGTETSKALVVNDKFPELKSITVEQPTGTYTSGNLVFTLNFEDVVYATSAAPATVSITLANRNATNNHNTGGTTETVSGTSYQSFRRHLTTTGLPATAANAVSSISFTWNVGAANIRKEMLDGLYVSNVDFAGLRDIYGNAGRDGSAAVTGNFVLTINKAVGNYTCANIPTGYIVDRIAPRVNVGTAAVGGVAASTPINAEGRTVSDRATSVSGDNRTIILRFNEPVTAGNGIITIKPHGDYFIPAVFENAGYYDSDGAWVPGMTDIFNAVDDSGKIALIGGTSMSSPPLDTRSGQAGTPYVRITHGLKAGAGYSGSYSSATLNGPFHSAADSLSTDYMIPNTTTKWVLEWRYSINGSAESYYTPTGSANATPVVAAPVAGTVRDVLTAAKFRWQEIDVTSSSVAISGSTVTITLPRPLNKGLEWDLYYPEGTFEDNAGNKAAAVDSGDYWFLSNGAQTPVIRVNRKSYDARTTGWQGTGRTYADPTAREATHPSAGWNINDFSTVHYRIETETPNATLNYGTLGEQASDTTTDSVAVVHNNTVTTAWANIPGATGTTTWNSTDYTARWVRNNLVRRASASANTARSYTVYENGASITRGTQGDYRGFRSYNKDALATDLSDLTLGSSYSGPVTPAPTAGATSGFFFSYYPTEASKSYVVATATINHGTTATTYTSGRGSEGVFRSVVALEQSNTTIGIAVEGSNIKNGMPSIAGFPVRDAEETGDNRFIKLFYRNGNQRLWVSTEIVSQWYFLKWGGGSTTHQDRGEVDNYLTAGYGDLTFGYQIQ